LLIRIILDGVGCNSMYVGYNIKIMTLADAIILAVVEGLTEFLPISSTGHLILVTRILNITTTDFTTSFAISIQCGAILAVAMLYANHVIRHPMILKPVIVAFLPTAATGLVLYKIIKNILLLSTDITVTALIIGGILIILIEKILIYKVPPSGEIMLGKITFRQAIFIGIAQSLSVVPGVSRAGATIVGGLLAGLTRKNAVEFSFLLAVPTVIAATVLDLASTSWRFRPEEILIMLVGLIVSFISAAISVNYFLKFVRSNTLIIFGAYRIIFAVAFIMAVR